MATRRVRAERKNTEAGESNGGGPRVRYAVVGLGYIAQTAILPAFANAKKNSQLAALVSDDPTKLETLGRKYKVDKPALRHRHLLALEESARHGKSVKLAPFERTQRPDLQQAVHRPLGTKPRLVHAQKPDRAES